MATTSNQLGQVVIGAREIYDAVLHLSAGVDGLTKRHDDSVTQLGDHEARLRSLERSRWPLPSLAAVISVASIVMTLVLLLRH